MHAKTTFKCIVSDVKLFKSKYRRGKDLATLPVKDVHIYDIGTTGHQNPVPSR